MVLFQPPEIIGTYSSSATVLPKHNTIYTKPKNAQLVTMQNLQPIAILSSVGHGMAASVLPKEPNNNEPWRGLLPALRDKRGPVLNYLATWAISAAPSGRQYVYIFQVYFIIFRP